MPKVLVADEISGQGLEILKEVAAVDYLPKISQSELLSCIADYDGLLVRSRAQVTAEVIKAGANLKIIGRAGVGVDNIDLQVATECGVLVINSPEGNTASAAEHTLALMFSLCRQISPADQSMKQKKWNRSEFMGVELFNKTLGIIGLGKIGRRVAAVASSLGMKLLAYDPLVSPEMARELNIKLVALDEIWEQADFITVHTPKTRETTNLLSADVFKRLKPGVRIINASRGGIVDETALAEAIKEGHVAGAALDVFAQEPPESVPLADLGTKVVLTPHLGASTYEAQFNVAIDTAEQMRDYLLGELVRSPVNLPHMKPEVMRSLGRYVWLAETMGTIVSHLAVDSVINEVEVAIAGALAHKDCSPLSVAVLKGLFSSRVEGVTYVNAPLVAKNHGIHVRVSVQSEDGEHDELTVTVSGGSRKSTISGTLLSATDAIITRINDFPINLTPQRYMLFTSHSDQPGMVARVAGILGSFDINISTMSVARRAAREEAIMVMGLDDPLTAQLVKEVAVAPGIHMAHFVALERIS